MRRSWFSRRWLGGLVGCALVAAGCHHAERSCPTCGRPPRVAADDAPRPAVAALPAPLSPYAVVTSVPTVTVHETLKPVPPPEPVVSDRHEWQTVSGTIREKLMARRTFTDLTVSPAFAHAKDYSWLVGELRSIGPGVWCVRFASVDEDRDTVTLVDAPPMTDLHHGQMVRVEGELVDPSAHDAGQGYRVTAIRAFERN